MMNIAALDAALKGRKSLIDKHSVEGIGESLGAQPTSSGVSKQTNFYTGDFIDKSKTGYVGISNQGATCYLNGLLQTLFMTPELRKAVYEWQYEESMHGTKDLCIPYQLQKLFADLQLSLRGQVKTENLTKSFGWNRHEAFVQHDIVELCDVLFDHLDRNSQGSNLSHVVKTQYRGATTDYVQCKTCLNFRGRPDSYVCLSLPVDGVNSLQDALATYSEPELLDGDNKYMCGICNSKQPALKGIRFAEFPYFLSVQLRRFTMNWQTLQRVKLKHDITFPKILDIQHYVHDDPEARAEGAPQGGAEYELYSILVHTGSANGGHYFAYIKNFKTGKWVKFNDSVVSEIDEEDIEDVFLPREQRKKAKAPKPASQVYQTTTTAAPRLAAGAPPPAAGAPPPLAAGAPPPLAAGAPPPLAAGAPPPLAAPPPAAAAPPAAAPPAAAPPAAAPPAAAPLGGPVPLDPPPAAGPPPGPPPPATIPAVTRGKWKTVVGQDKALDVGTVEARASPAKPLQLFIDPVTNAYMLMYRRIDKEKNVDEVDDAKIQEDLVKIINDENEVYKVQKAEFDRLRNILNIRVRYDNDIHDAEVKKDETLDTALKIVYDTLKLSEADIPIERVRFRNFDVLKNLPGAPLTQHDKLIKEFNFRDNKDLMLDVRTEGEEWEDFLPGQMNLRMIELDLATMTYKEDVIIQTNEDGTAGELRASCARKLKVEPEHVKVVFLTDEAADVLEDDQYLKKDCRVFNGDTIHVEVCDNYKQGASQIVRKFEDVANEIVVKFNKVGTFEPEFEIKTDLRESLADLKKLISDKLGIGPHEFKVRRAIHDQEFKDLAQNLAFYSLVDGCTIFIDEGPPLQPSQYLFQIFLEVLKSGAEEDRFLLIGEIVVDETWSMSRFKEEVAKLPQAPPAKFQRIREWLMKRMIRVYLDDVDLKTNVRGMIDYKQLVIQQTDTEEFLTKDSLLLNILQWHPVEFKTGEEKEIALNKNLTIPELKAIVASLYSIPLEDVRVVQPWSYQLKELKELPILDWQGLKLYDFTTLCTKPWCMKSGDYILFKDNKQPERYKADQPDLIKVHHVPEQAFKIYTKEEQAENKMREEEMIAKAEAEEKDARDEAVKRREDALEKLKSQQGIPGKLKTLTPNQNDLKNENAAKDLSQPDT